MESHLMDTISRTTSTWTYYAYPFNWNPKRKLVHWQGKLIGNTSDGLLAFSYDEGRVRGGASGGIVVDGHKGVFNFARRVWI